MPNGTLSLSFSRFTDGPGINKAELKKFTDEHNISVVIWDVDGTLYSLSRLKRKILTSSGIFSLPQILKIQKLVEEQRREPLSLVDKDILQESSYDRVQRKIAERLSPGMTDPRAEMLLKSFSEMGLQQVALSDHPPAQKVAKLNLQKYFSSQISCYEDTGFWKPSPKIKEYLESFLGIPGKNYLFVGDREDTDGELAFICSAAFLHL